MYLHVICISQQLYITVPVGLMLCDVVLEACDECYVAFFHSSVVLKGIDGSCQVLDSQADGDGCEELRYGLQFGIGQWVCQYSVRDDPIVYENGCGGHSSMIV